LNVHEGPQGIGPRIAYNDAQLKAGMILSNGGFLVFSEIRETKPL
jgi:Xaa-Pro aminopeptidase